MTTPGNIEVVIPADTDYTSESWDVSKQVSGSGSIQIVWSSLNATNGTFAINVSLDNVNWLASGCSNPKRLTTASGIHIWEIPVFTTRYLQIVYSKGSNTAGSIRLTTYKHPDYRS